MILGIPGSVNLRFLGQSKNTNATTRTSNTAQCHIYYYTRKLKLLPKSGTAHL